MAKRKPKRKQPTVKKNQNHRRLKIINIILLILVITLSVTIVSYYFILHEKQTTSQVKTETQKKPTIKKPSVTQKIEEKLTHVEKAFEEYTDELKKDYTHEPVVPTEEPSVITPEQPKATFKSDKPKIAIVIDDVTLKSQVKKLQSIDYKVNMSFMPPTKKHPNSAKIAQNLPFYMIHFPMQANSFKFEETNTLHIGDSYEKIEQRVKAIREFYPEAVFTNNHTGSKFTSDHDSMDKLFRALKKYNFSFLDSRTTAKTVAKEYATKYGVPFLARNIFLDNELKYDYIQGQLKKAIAIAKKSGYAIAIGHPHSITIQVLKESNNLLKDLDVVYINELPIN